MRRLSGLDKFNLIAGIIGLIADVIGLTSLMIASAKYSQSIQSGVSQTSTVNILWFSYIALLFFFILVFSFFTITVVLLTKYVPKENLYNSRVARPALFLGTLPYATWCGYVVFQTGSIMDGMSVSSNIEIIVIVVMILVLVFLYLPGMNFLITSAADLTHLILSRRNVTTSESNSQNTGNNE